MLLREEEVEQFWWIHYRLNKKYTRKKTLFLGVWSECRITNKKGTCTCTFIFYISIPIPTKTNPLSIFSHALLVVWNWKTLSSVNLPHVSSNRRRHPQLTQPIRWHRRLLRIQPRIHRLCDVTKTIQKTSIYIEMETRGL
jgi:hypothetical protein